MDRQTMILVVALIVSLVAGMFVFAYLKRMEYENTKVATTPSAPPREEKKPDGLVTRIDAKHFFDAAKTEHTLAGELMMPTPCDLLTTNAVLLDDGKRVVISFDVINNSQDICAQVITPQRFKIPFSASRDVKMEAYYKGTQIPLNLIPATEGEKPSDFELFIKG